MIAQFYPPDVGGEESHVHDLSVALAARGHTVAVATFWYEGLPEYEVVEGVRIYRIRSTMQRATFLYSTARQHAPPFPDPEALAGLRRVIAQERPEIVHAHNWLLHSFVPLKAWSGAKFVVTLHDYSLVCARKTLLRADAICAGPGWLKCLRCAPEQYGVSKAAVTVLANFTFSRVERAAVDMFIAVSHAVAVHNGLVAHSLPHRVIPNFVPDDMGESARLSPSQLSDRLHLLLRERVQLPEDDYLLYVGDVRRAKGVHILLEAYTQLKQAPPLVLVGRLNLDLPSQFPPNVVALDRLPHEAVTAIREHSLLALTPSLWAEPFGIVVIEAMASGRAVIASRIGGIPDIVIDDETGLLVPPGDVKALRDAIERLLADPALRERLGAAGQRKVAEFYASAVVPQIEQVYAELLRR
jgi:glycosyltransferase involved in cell wall biosynthesis